MKKLIATTALVSLAVLSSANAETKISGNLGIGFLAHSYDPASGTSATSFNAVGRESQINISNSGTLNNGVKYAAGFSWEADGAESIGGASTAENTYIDFIFGDTTLSLSADHMDNLNANPTNLVGFGFLQAANGLYDRNSGYVGGNYSASLVQKIGGTNVTLSYIPHSNGNLAANDVFDGTTSASDGTSGASATSMIVKGDLGIKGVSALIGQDKVSKNDATKETKKTKFSIGYTAGNVKVAAETDKYDTGTASTEVESKSIGLAYAVSDTMSVGVTYGEAEYGVMTSKSTEETTMFAVGYNLGAVSVQAQYKTVDNLKAATGVDAQELGLYVGTKF
jgi:hypothetical protein